MNPILLDIPESVETERLLIRVPKAGDGALLHVAVHESLPELLPWIPWARSHDTVEQSEEIVRRNHARFILREDMTMLMFRKSDGALIGGIGYHRMDWQVPRVEIGYWLRTSMYGQGYMREAVQTMTDFALNTLHAKRIEIRCDSRNLASIRVAQRAGYTLDATFYKNNYAPGGTLCDLMIFSKVVE